MDSRISDRGSFLESSKNAYPSPMNGSDSKGGLDCGDRNHPSACSKMDGDISYKGNLEGLDVVREENVARRISPGSVGPRKKTDAMNDDAGVDGNSAFVFSSRRNITNQENLFPWFPPNMTFYTTKKISKAHARMKKESEKIIASGCAQQKSSDFRPGVGISSSYTSNFNQTKLDFEQEFKNSSASIIQMNKSIPGENSNELHRAISKENPQLHSIPKKSIPPLHIDETEKKTQHVPFVSQTEERISDNKREAETELPSILDAAASLAAQETCERCRLR